MGDPRYLSLHFEYTFIIYIKGYYLMLDIYILFTIISIFLIYFIYFVFFTRYTPKQKQKKKKEQKSDANLEVGKNFEQKISNIISHYIKKEWVFQNIYLNSANGRVTEIDVLAIHNTGIYIIECKFMNSKVIGDADDKNWVQIKNNNVCIDFLNPVIQNNNHLNACKMFLDKFKLPYYSIIVFGDKCILPDIKSYKVKDTYIVRKKELASLMRLFTSQKKLYSNKVIDAISELIKTKSRKPNK